MSLSLGRATRIWSPAAAVFSLAVVLTGCASGSGAGSSPPASSPGSSGQARLASGSPRATTQTGSQSTSLPRVRHVFVVNLENSDFASTWGPSSRAPYLAKTLRAKGVLLTHYYGTGHHSLTNYIAEISGQGPNQQSQGDCHTYTKFQQTRTAANQQSVGGGCVFPASVNTLVGQLAKARLTWRGYMEAMPAPCEHPKLGQQDPWSGSSASNEYATKHDPFMYFASITGKAAYCRSHVVALSHLTTDLKSAATTRNLSYITPDLCNDGHDFPCSNGQPGGLPQVNSWMRTWIPRILASPAFRKDGLLVITADESDSSSAACCHEGPGPNAAHPGINGPGGGLIGALVISPYVAPGTTSSRAYNHYSLLASVENLFRLGHIGYARTAGLPVFGTDVYSR